MDNQTRFGAGAGIGLTIATIMYEWIGWPWNLILVLVLAGGMVWCFWPLARSFTLGRGGFLYVPIRRAAEIAFEKLEGTLAGDAINQAQGNEHDRLTFMYACFKADKARVYAKRPPSNKRRPIPADELNNLIVADDGSNDLLPLGAMHRGAVYRDAVISRLDLLMVIRKRRKLGAKMWAA